MLWYGWPARVIITFLAVMGFLLAMGDVLDTYDAYWKFSVPLTFVYAALIWIFALSPPKGQPKPTPVWPLGLDIIIGKTFMTIVLLLCTLGAVALIWDLCKLAVDHWHIEVAGIGLLAAIFLWAWLSGAFNDKKIAKKAAKDQARRARFAANEERSGGRRGRASFMRGKVWTWGVVAPAFAAAFVGVIVDIVTGTVLYWPFLVPSYVVVAMLNWRGMSDWAQAAADKKARAKRLADLDEEIAKLDAEEAKRTGKHVHAHRTTPEQPSIVAADEALVEEPIVTMVRQHNVWGFVGELLILLLMRLPVTIGMALLYMVAVYAVIEIGTWGRGYWYIYGPVFAGIALFAWYVWRSGPADDQNTAVTSAGDPLVR